MLLPLSIFAFVILGAIAGYLVLHKPQRTVVDRLQDLAGPGGWDGEFNTEETERRAKESQAAEIAKKVAQDLNRVAPISAKEAKKLQLKLMHAGYRAQNAPIIFRAIQLISLALFPAVTVLGLIVSGKSLSDSMLYIGGALLTGFMLPDKVLSYKVNARQDRLRCGVADALDLLVVSVEAGLGLNMALNRVAEEMKTVHPDISEEFTLVNTEIRMGRQREEALRNLAERSGVEDLRSLCAMLIQTDRFGTSIARAIRVYSEALRTKRRQRAEQAAQKAAVKMLFPLAVFLFPTLFIILLGPSAIQLMRTFGDK
jgi:tight adherence protein C